MPAENIRRRDLSRLLRENLRKSNHFSKSVTCLTQRCITESVTGFSSARIGYNSRWQYENKYHVWLKGYPSKYKLMSPSYMTSRQLDVLLHRYDAGALRFVFIGEEGLRKVREKAIAERRYSPKPRKSRSDSGYPHRFPGAHRPTRPPNTRETMTESETALDVEGHDCLRVHLQGAWMDKEKRWNLVFGSTCERCRAQQSSSS